MSELGILAYGPRSEDDVTPVALVIHTSQLGTLLQKKDLAGAYNLNSMLINQPASMCYASIVPVLLRLCNSEEKDNG